MQRANNKICMNALCLNIFICVKREQREEKRRHRKEESKLNKKQNKNDTKPFFIFRKK